MDNKLIKLILDGYGLAAVKIHVVQKGYRNQSYAATLADGQMVNLILYKSEPDILDKIRCANYVSDFLAEQGMPARQTANTQIAQLKPIATPCTGSDPVHDLGRRFAGVYWYLPGRTIPWEAYTMDHIKQLGAMMSDMHAALKPLPQKNLPFVIDECRALLARMEKYFAEDGVRDAMASKLGLAILDTTRLRPSLTECVQLSHQALHMDFVRGNILFGESEEPQITGILDFEKTAYGPPIFDIARTLAFLIVDCKYKDEAKVRKYFLYSGYNKRGQSSFQPSPLLENLLDFFLLHDFYKFLRHNPYQSLEKNEHFVRTRDFLLKRNIIAKTEMLE